MLRRTKRWANVAGQLYKHDRLVSPWSRLASKTSAAGRSTKAKGKDDGLVKRSPGRPRKVAGSASERDVTSSKTRSGSKDVDSVEKTTRGKTPRQQDAASPSSRPKSVRSTPSTMVAALGMQADLLAGLPTGNQAHQEPSIPDTPPSKRAAAKQAIEDAVNTRTLPTALLERSDRHHDLLTYLEYAQQAGIDHSSNVYRGTCYEYTVAATLEAYNFTLKRTGRSNDLGIDLVGFFTLPQAKKTIAPHDLRVIVQCKLSDPQPSMARELEGAYAGAPAGWRDRGVLSLLATRGSVTPGVVAAMQRSQWPMLFMQVTAAGELRQFIWNARAAETGLQGLGVTVKYGGDGASGGGKSGLALTWLGEVVPMQARQGKKEKHQVEG